MTAEALATFLANGWTPASGRPPLDDDWMDDAVGILDFLNTYETDAEFRARWDAYVSEVPLCRG